MKELEEKIEMLQQDINEVTDGFLPEMYDLYESAEDDQIRINALNSIIGLKDHNRSDIELLRQMKRIYDKNKEEQEHPEKAEELEEKDMKCTFDE